MEIDLRDIHILDAKCYETDSTVIQLMLIRDKPNDIYSALKLNGGNRQEEIRGDTYENCEKRYKGWDNFYKAQGCRSIKLPV